MLVLAGESPGDGAGAAFACFPDKTSPWGNEKDGGLGFLACRSHLKRRESHKQTTRLLQNRSGLVVVRKIEGKARKTGMMHRLFSDISRYSLSLLEKVCDIF